jgi:hypothetical protein
MISRGKRYHAMLALLLVKFRQSIEGAAKLEGADTLQVLAFEKHLSVEQAVYRARRQDRCAISLANQA